MPVISDLIGSFTSMPLGHKSSCNQGLVFYMHRDLFHYDYYTGETGPFSVITPCKPMSFTTFICSSYKDYMWTNNIVLPVVKKNQIVFHERNMKFETTVFSYFNDSKTCWSKFKIIQKVKN